MARTGQGDESKIGFDDNILLFIEEEKTIQWEEREGLGVCCRSLDGEGSSYT